MTMNQPTLPTIMDNHVLSRVLMLTLKTNSNKVNANYFQDTVFLFHLKLELLNSFQTVLLYDYSVRFG